MFQKPTAFKFEMFRIDEAADGFGLKLTECKRGWSEISHAEKEQSERFRQALDRIRHRFFARTDAACNEGARSRAERAWSRVAASLNYFAANAERS
jgi:hypothetical protein